MVWGGLYRPSELQYTPMNIAFNIIQTVRSPLIYQFNEIKNLIKKSVEKFAFWINMKLPLEEHLISFSVY